MATTQDSDRAAPQAPRRPFFGGASTTAPMRAPVQVPVAPVISGGARPKSGRPQLPVFDRPTAAPAATVPALTPAAELTAPPVRRNALFANLPRVDVGEIFADFDDVGEPGEGSDASAVRSRVASAGRPVFDVPETPASAARPGGKGLFAGLPRASAEEHPSFDDDGADADGGDDNGPSAPRSGSPSFGGARAREPVADTGPKTEEVIGRLDNLRMIGDWSVGQIWNDQRAQVKITGKDLAELVEGLEYTFVGYRKSHSTYGESLEVVAATPYISPSITAISKFLSISYKGIGLVKADRFVKAIRDVEGNDGLERLRNQLIMDPGSLDLTSLAAGAAYQPNNGMDPSDTGLGRQSAVYRELATKIGAIPGIRSTIFKGLAKWLVARNGPYEGAIVPADLTTRCWAMYARDPYSAIADVEGYGWAMADAVGRATNVPRDDPRRLSALIKYALDVGCEKQGHAFLSERELLAAVQGVDPRVNVAESLILALKHRLVVQDEQDRIYPINLHRAEQRLAQGLSKLLVESKSLLRDDEKAVNERIAETASKLGFESGLDVSQMNAVSSILRSPCRIHTLTGGPGCGKTAVMEVLASMLPGKEIVFATPTGKAAKVLSNRLKRLSLSASTLHSTLGGGIDGGFFHGKDDPLDGDLFVIDESSMPDLELMDAAVNAMNEGMHLVLLGDPGQLPSIGPGRVLRDVLEMEGVDHNHLSTTHRNSGGILELIKSCGAGRIDLKDTSGVTFSRGLGDASEQIRMVTDEYQDAVARRGYENVILLMSRRKGHEDEPGWNTTYANSLLRKLCNPDGMKVPGTNLFVNDRIIITVNKEIEQRGAGGPNGAPTERVVNGDTGTIIGFSDPNNRNSSSLKRTLTPEFIDLRLDDGRVINFPGQLAPTSLGHSYALTVHAGQGSEYQEVILVATPGAPAFINQSMLFTGLSRARESLKVFAKDADLVSIAATPCPARNTALLERVEAALEKEEECSSPPRLRA